MSGRRRSKRKAAEAALDAMAGIQRCESEAKSIVIGPKSQPLFEFHGVCLPDDVMTKIVDYLPKKELVHRASLVNASWRAAAQHPFLWPVLGSKLWKQDPSKPTSIQFFLDVLRRPQFSRLRYLEPPNSVQRPKNTTVWDRLANACPHLQVLDLGNAKSLHPSCDEELLRLSVLFPKLGGIGINGNCGDCFVTGKGVAKFAQLQGAKLQVLAVRAEYPTLLSDKTLHTLSQSCPNLKEFCYAGYGYPWNITPSGVVAFLQSCLKLQVMVLLLRHCDASTQVLNAADTFLGPKGYSRECKFYQHRGPLREIGICCIWRKIVAKTPSA